MRTTLDIENDVLFAAKGLARQITGAYFLAVAVRNGGRLVPFDSGIALAAVKGAQARHLVTIA